MPLPGYAHHLMLILVTMSLACGAAAGGVTAGDKLTEAEEAAKSALKKALTFRASFDESLEADFARGGRKLSTRFNHETDKDKHVFEKGYDAKVFRVARGKGIHGGALEALDVLPRNGRIFYPGLGNLAFRKGGWGGAVSVWVNTDPDKLFKTKFCDPVQITQKGALNGGIWFDFNDAKPRHLRHGAFPAVKPNEKALSEDDADAPMVRVPKPGFKQGKWHHVVLSWKNFDTSSKNTSAKDAVSAMYIDGKLIGEVKDRAIAMGWDLERTGIYVAVNYIGLLDELSVFDRPLTMTEVTALWKRPGLLSEP
ncbi:MAG: LamG domain-containing protein [Planctomycetes bacterium]|nr:LamG domain-containing protein [Planctomycetota bacterium]